ncbi:uncharacterized protein ARMOST_07963 [Armillaria ostoyae]|uniref:Uncharacterized protein n=1 Tax=Armillaria ostoyae TaxID=47428 RepID=A0A284R790_ARMOS|nr:uncharacterized protein ARMOST_07963 [Armillaria ostoyae]
MSPSVDELNFRQTVTANMLNHGTLVTYDPKSQTLKVMPYPGVKTPQRKVITVPLDKLINHLHVHGISLGSCVCGPKSGEYDKYTSLHLIVCKAGSLPANVGKYALVYANGPHDGCGWFGPLSNMMNRYNSEPTFVVHSNRKKKSWPGPLVDVRMYVFAGGQKQTLPAPDYHPLPFMSDDNEADDDFHSPVKAEGSAIKCSASTSPISCSNSASPTKRVRSISKPQSRGLSFSSSTPTTPQKLTQHINPATPLSYVDPPTPKSSQRINPATPLSYDPSTPKSSHRVDPSTPGLKQLSPTATQMLLSLDGLMTPNLKPKRNATAVTVSPPKGGKSLSSPEKPSPVLSSYSSTTPKSSLSASIRASSYSSDLPATPKRKCALAPFPFEWTPKKESSHDEDEEKPQIGSDDDGFFGDVSEIASSSKTIKRLKNHSAIRASANLHSPTPDSWDRSILTPQLKKKAKLAPKPTPVFNAKPEGSLHATAAVDLTISDDEGPAKKKRKTKTGFPPGPQIILNWFKHWPENPDGIYYEDEEEEDCLARKQGILWHLTMRLGHGWSRDAETGYEEFTQIKLGILEYLHQFNDKALKVID